jgi:hypothetical protein
VQIAQLLEVVTPFQNIAGTQDKAHVSLEFLSHRAAQSIKGYHMLGVRPGEMEE